MEEKKLTDEEIVKALECCSKSWDCNNCKCDKENNNRFICSENLLKDCLDLIHRQKAEIERLKTFIDFKTANIMCAKCRQRVVKNTAKEIFEEIFYDCWAIKDENGHRVFDEGKIKDFAEKCYGVEVE